MLPVWSTLHRVVEVGTNTSDKEGCHLAALSLEIWFENGPRGSEITRSGFRILPGNTGHHDPAWATERLSSLKGAIGALPLSTTSYPTECSPFVLVRPSDGDMPSPAGLSPDFQP